MSRVTCHVSHVTCNISHDQCIFFQRGELVGGASRWRVCYQGGLPRLVVADGQSKELEVNSAVWWMTRSVGVGSVGVGILRSSDAVWQMVGAEPVATARGVMEGEIKVIWPFSPLFIFRNTL